jgi:hypothetical protein
VTNERELDACHLVVQRVPRHAEIPRGRVDIEPPRLDGRTRPRDGFLLFRRGCGGRDDVSRFHGNLSKLSRGVVGEDVLRGAMRVAWRVVRSRPRVQRPFLTAMALSRGNLESARVTGPAGEDVAAE